jgi:DNA/RNA-binding domain of Phe-tRNA-synthetase-like protein
VTGLRVRAEIDLEFTALELYELEITEPRDDFELEVARAVAAAKSNETASLARARPLYRKFDVDPTRNRPSSEALLRRLKRGDGFPRVNSLVDVANALSVQYQVPVGLYDLDKIRGQEVAIRLGKPGEGYTGIGKDHVNVEGRPCVADDEGPCGNPSSDSARTMITTSTERALWLYFLPVGDAEVDRTAELVAVFGRGLVRAVE